jgi:hypothetical protein
MNKRIVRRGKNKMRGLSEKFMNDLSKPEGNLYPILERVRKDHNLMLAIRDGYINIYYRGGNIIRINQCEDLFQSFFDVNFAKSGQIVANAEKNIRNKDDARNLVSALTDRKIIMDEYFALTSKTTEREFQQLVARENNNSSISNESEYFVTDIEVAIPHLARFDITAIRWLANQRKNGNKCRAALIEMKYGDRALGNDAGLLKHLQDMDTLISEKKQYANLLQTMECQFNQLDELKLLNFNKGVSNAKVKLDPEIKPEVIFVLANHNPRSPKLISILDNTEFDKYDQSNKFDLRFYIASFAGYGLHSNCMLTLAEFRKSCKWFLENTKNQQS